MKPRWRVLIIDDHAPSRAALAEAVTAQGGQVVGNGSRAEDVLRLMDKHHPDIAVLAVGLPDGDGVEAAGGGMTVSPRPGGRGNRATEDPGVGRAGGEGRAGVLPQPVGREE